MGFPSLVRVANDGGYRTLEANCLTKKTLPSLAFGGRSCSDKYKRRPQDKFVAAWEPARQAWAAGRKVLRLIGIDADEAHRAKITEDARYQYEYPLVAWEWGRDECLAAIRSAGLPLPPKSSCFFCPASTKAEIRWLAETHPDLFERTVAMEEAARPNTTSVRGLGRRFAWSEVVARGRIDLPVLPDAPPTPPCGCFDGE